MESKTCKKCNEEKPIDNFGKYTKRDGSKDYRNVCKPCQNAMARKKDKDVEVASQIIEKPKEIKPKVEVKLQNQFTDHEVATLKLVVQERDNITLDYDMNKENRERRAYNINADLANKVIQYSKKERVSASDIVNKALQDFFYKNG